MLPGSREALRTERYLDGLLVADEQRAGAPLDVDTDPQVVMASAALRAGLVRVHPSFRFEEALAGRLAEAAQRLRAGLPAEVADGATAGQPAGATRPATIIAAFPRIAASGGPGTAEAGDTLTAAGPSAVLRRIPGMAARQSKPLVIGGVGVASAALSLGAFSVAWSHTHAASGRMGRAARNASGRAAHSGRRPGIAEEIIGAVS